jgi:hypothetical protein
VKRYYDHLVEGQQSERDRDLGRALAELRQPETPDDLENRLRSAIEKERRRNRRRPGLREWLALLLIAAAIGGAFAWRYAPPGEATMAQLRTAVETRRDNLIPTPPEAAIARGRMTAKEREVLEREVARNIAACCTPRFAHEQIVEKRAPRDAVQASAKLLSQGAEWPARVARQAPGHMEMVRRNWDGSLVMRVDRPGHSRSEASILADLYVFRRVDGRWLIDEIIYRGN